MNKKRTKLRSRTPFLVGSSLLCIFLGAGIFHFYHISFLMTRGLETLGTHHQFFLVWRIGLLILLFAAWPLIVRAKNKGRALLPEQYQRLVALRYPIVLFLLIFDLILQGGFSQ